MGILDYVECHHLYAVFLCGKYKVKYCTLGPQQARLGHIDVKMMTDVMLKLHAYLKVGLRSISKIKMASLIYSQ